MKANLSTVLQLVVTGRIVLTDREQRHGLCELISHRCGLEAAALFKRVMCQWPDAAEGDNPMCPVEGCYTGYNISQLRGTLWSGTGGQRRIALAKFVWEHLS